MDSAAASLLSRMSAPPDTARAGLIDACVRALKAAGVWAKLDLLYVLAAHDAQAARLNWRGSSFALTAVNSPGFTPNRGYAGDGATSYLDTGWDPATNGVTYTQDSASIAGWSRSAGQSNGYWIGTASGINAGIRPRSTADSSAFYVNGGSAAAGNVVADGTGLWAGSRTSASNVQPYRNGAMLALAASIASTTPVSLDFAIGRARGSYNAAQCAACAIGGGLSGAEQLALYRALSAYLTGVGAA